ncbi:MAG TPA: N-formylglutamate deformylase [Hypericibacter adhaerens]|uniref:N-formylglutamate deformylase n=1 Tax=Hypericibacter adhaerens TaxID=2602016 RepID=UPI002C702733|nr:N-formylglutamate deformylase [Hypericibacter adhaerens]HWA42505.1 N-formylglutamate deformylase [Hypericibacter adhaerens]
MEPFRFEPGPAPLLISMPHVGTHLPDALARRMTDVARTVPDTDWHVDRLYDFAAALGANRLIATHSRYVIDLNRPPDGTVLYPGASNTELCPTTSFDDEPLWQPDQAPGAEEIRQRVESFWRPYHKQLADALAAIKSRFGMALLFDAHSIRSEVPRFFAGRLPDINLGTADGKSAPSELAARLIEAAGEADGYSSVLNGRFKGGYITRLYGKPAEGIAAVQLELSQITYMDEAPPFGFREDRAKAVRPHLRRILETMLEWAKETKGVSW